MSTHFTLQVLGAPTLLLDYFMLSTTRVLRYAAVLQSGTVILLMLLLPVIKNCVKALVNGQTNEVSVQALSVAGVAKHSILVSTAHA
jgi:hypothetical protein